MCRPPKSFACSSSIAFLSEREQSIILPKNFIGFVCIDGIYEEKSVGLDGGEIQNGELLITLPLMSIILLDLSALNFKPAQFSAVTHLLSSMCAPCTETDMMLMSSINARIKGSSTLSEWTTLGTLQTKTYSIMTFMAHRKSIIESVQP